jgi:hypothetical protein
MTNKNEDRLTKSIKQMNELPNEAPHKANIKGKWYTMVQSRIVVFRENFGTDGAIETDLIHADNDRVVIKASIYIDGAKVSNGYAEEYRSQGIVNPQSAIENCETSAIGRALAVLGLHGGEMSSAFEMDNVISGKKPKAPTAKYRIKNKSATMATAKDESDYLKSCRAFLNDPSSEEHQMLFLNNISDITKAKDSAKGKTKEAYVKLLNLYGYEENNDEDEKTDSK